MRHRLSLVLSVTALAVAVLGSTPLGGAAVDVVTAVPPFAKKAGYATNAGAVNKIKAARKPTPGYLVPLGADGKFPASVGQVGPPGPEGPQGQQGAQGTPGPIGPSDAFTQTNVNPVSVGAGGATLASLTLASGKYVLIGRASFQGPQQIVRCRFSPSGSSIDTVDTTVPSYEIEIVNQDTVALSASSTAVDYRCSAFGGGAQAFNTVLTAIKVGEITNQ